MLNMVLAVVEHKFSSIQWECESIIYAGNNYSISFENDDKYEI